MESAIRALPLICLASGVTWAIKYRKENRGRHFELVSDASEGRVVYFNNPDAVLDIEVNYKAPFEELAVQLKLVAKRICSNWSNIPDGTIKVKQISGGITNMLYKLHTEDEAVLVRLYGDNTDVVIDRNKDNRNFAFLSLKGYAPCYYGQFRNGRIEGWFEARPLEPHELGQTSPINFSRMIARELARLHLLAPEGNRTPVLFPSIDGYLHLVRKIVLEDPTKQAVELNVSQISSELMWLKSKLPSDLNSQGNELMAQELDDLTQQATLYAYEVTFCHNDLLSGNIMHGDGWDRVQVIDYEYGGYNHRAYDIANHFIEHTGFNLDLENAFPSEAQQVYFLKEYLQVASPELLHSLQEKRLLNQFCKKLYRVVCEFTLASHLFWGLWAIVQARYSPIDFDFAAYARLRIVGYFFHKDQFFTQDNC